MFREYEIRKVADRDLAEVPQVELVQGVTA
jgi:hypothetical protein